MATQPNRDGILVWRKSTASGNDGACVEIAESGSSVLVRDSGNQSGAILVFTFKQWLGLLRRIKNEKNAPSR